MGPWLVPGTHGSPCLLSHSRGGVLVVRSRRDGNRLPALQNRNTLWIEHARASVSPVPFQRPDDRVRVAFAEEPPWVPGWSRDPWFPLLAGHSPRRESFFAAQARREQTSRLAEPQHLMDRDQTRSRSEKGAAGG